ncbi:MAG: hypothetical protein ABR910_07120 [Acidobacteriaceae bacterium]|jgi:hypothetical protein
MGNRVEGGLRTEHPLPGLLSRLFAGSERPGEVSTRVRLDVTPEDAWREIIFYEEVPGRPPLPLRWLMPAPVRTEGAKSAVGAEVRCIYDCGYLVKSITVFDPPCLIRFDVSEQHLGIEDCAIAEGGSYELYHSGDATELVLTTRYRSFLHPRWLWRPLERLVAHQLHSHVLRGMSAAMEQHAPAICPRNV